MHNGMIWHGHVAQWLTCVDSQTFSAYLYELTTSLYLIYFDEYETLHNYLKKSRFHHTLDFLHTQIFMPQ